jgi:hypothetical protein
MSVGERAAPIAASLSAISTLLCCLPLSFIGAFGIASLSAAMLQYRLWLIGLPAALIVVGFVQVYRRQAQCARRSTASLVMLWVSVFVVGLVFLLPQVVATLLASWLG